VAQLKSFMIKNNIPVEGRKADHIAAVEVSAGRTSQEDVI
jgi:hypothetical protein